MMSRAKTGRAEEEDVNKKGIMVVLLRRTGSWIKKLLQWQVIAVILPLRIIQR